MKKINPFLKASLTAALINGLLFGLGKISGILSESIIIPNAKQPLTLPPVLFASIVAVIVAGVLLRVLSRFNKKPQIIFNTVALVLLVLSFASPFSIPGISITMAIWMNVMHIVVAASILFFFETLKSKQNDK